MKEAGLFKDKGKIYKLELTCRRGDFSTKYVGTIR